MQGKREEGNYQGGAKGNFAREDKKRKKQVTEGIESGLPHSPIISLFTYHCQKWGHTSSYYYRDIQHTASCTLVMLYA